jgi:hypothetical protein
MEAGVGVEAELEAGVEGGEPFGLPFFAYPLYPLIEFKSASAFALSTATWVPVSCPPQPPANPRAATSRKADTHLRKPHISMHSPHHVCWNNQYRGIKPRA